jgi:hypothetical protein
MFVPAFYSSINTGESFSLSSVPLEAALCSKQEWTSRRCEGAKRELPLSWSRPFVVRFVFVRALCGDILKESRLATIAWITVHLSN